MRRGAPVDEEGHKPITIKLVWKGQSPLQRTFSSGPNLRRVTLLTRRTNRLVASLLASALISAGVRSFGTARFFPLGGAVPPLGKREQAGWYPLGIAYTDSERCWRG